jgi:hypothetical protein
MFSHFAYDFSFVFCFFFNYCCVHLTVVLQGERKHSQYDDGIKAHNNMLFWLYVFKRKTVV